MYEFGEDTSHYSKIKGNVLKNNRKGRTCGLLCRIFLFHLFKFQRKTSKPFTCKYSLQKFHSTLYIKVSCLPYAVHSEYYLQ